MLKAPKIFIRSMLVVCLACLLLSGCAGEEKPTLSPQPVARMSVYEPRYLNRLRYRLREFGIYEIGGKTIVTRDPQQPDRTLTSYTNRPAMRFLQITDKIPAVLNTHFGFTYDFEGPPFFGSTNLMVFIGHPPMTMPDGQTSTSVSWHSRLRLDAEGKAKSFVGFKFEKPFEMVTGRWVMRIYLDNELCLSKNFDVVAAKP